MKRLHAQPIFYFGIVRSDVEDRPNQTPSFIKRLSEPDGGGTLDHQHARVDFIGARRQQRIEEDRALPTISAPARISECRR